jgi:HEAT repeat protein
MNIRRKLFGPPDFKKIEEEKDIRLLCKLLRDDSDLIFDKCTSLLSRLNDVQALDCYTQYLLDKNNYISRRGVVARLMGELKDERAIDPLLSCLNEQFSTTETTVATALGNIGSVKAVPQLISCLENPKIFNKYAYAEALGNIGDKRAAKSLIEALQDSKLMNRKVYVDALGKIGDPIAVDTLTKELLDDPYDEETNLNIHSAYVRISAAGALGKIGDRKAIIPLVKTLEDDSIRLRIAVVEALLRIGPDKHDSRGSNKLVQYLRGASKIKEKNERRSKIIHMSMMNHEGIRIFSIESYMSDYTRDLEILRKKIKIAIEALRIKP